MLYQKAFLKSSQEDVKVIADLSNEVADACTQATTVDAKAVNAKLVEAVERSCLVENMAKFDATQEKNPLFNVTRQNMRMVMEMLQFIRAVRTGDWILHLQALHQVLLCTRSTELCPYDTSVSS